MDAKAQVEHYFKHDRTLLGGRNLYNKLPGKNLALQNRIARFTNTPENVEKLCYELAKTVDMPDRMRVILTQKPVVLVKDIDVIIEDVIIETKSTEDKLIDFNEKTADYKAAKALIKELGLELSSKKKADVYTALINAREELLKKK